MKELDFQRRNVLELMRDHLAALENASVTLDSKASQNIGINSIIVAIVGALNLGKTNLPQLQSYVTEHPFLVAIFLVYGLVFALSYVALWPREFATHPMKPTWEEAQNWLGLNGEEYYDKLLASYTDVVEKNEKIIERKAQLIRTATFFILIDVLLIFPAIVW